ncbi:MAG TPA: hypothetical protein PLZ57_03945 [Pseudobdellovibrionaceae bacterium]|nr:hypothetical protein [Pseudobdellovibrionaceae bacterium]
MALTDWHFRLPGLGLQSRSLHEFNQWPFALVFAIARNQCSRSLDLQLLRDLANESRGLFHLIAIDAELRKPNEAESPQVAHIPNLTWLEDSAQIVSRQFGFRRSGDFVILSTKDWTLHGRGHGLGSSNRNAHRAMIDLFVDKHAVPEELGEYANEKLGSDASLAALRTPSKCELPYAYPISSTPELNDEFLPSFKSACLSCHVKSGPLDIFKSLDDVISWRAMSLKTMRLERMPGVGDLRWRKLRGMSQSDLRTVAAWLENPPESIDEGSRHAFLKARESSLQSKVPRHLLDPHPISFQIPVASQPKVAAEGAPQILSILLGSPLPREAVIQGIEIETNLNVVHHVNIIAIPPHVDARAWLATKNQKGRGSMSGYFRRLTEDQILGTLKGKMGDRPARFAWIREDTLSTFSRRDGLDWMPPAAAFVLQPKTQIAAEFHLQPSGKPERVNLKLKLHRRQSPKPFQALERFTIHPITSFFISPGDEDFEIQVDFPAHTKMDLHRAWIHAHYRGAGLRIEVLEPSHAEEPQVTEPDTPQRPRTSPSAQTSSKPNEFKAPQIILGVPFMQFKLGIGSSFLPPVRIEKGSIIRTRISYNNSAANFANPDPKRRVRLGSDVLKDEMFFPRFIYTVPLKSTAPEMLEEHEEES